MARTCPSHHRPAVPPVRRPEQALAAIRHATDCGRTPCVAVGALTTERLPIGLIVVDGATTPDVPAVLEVVLEGLSGAAASLFTASSGPGATIPGATLFTAVEGQCRAADVAFLDWFVRVGRFWTAVGELRGREAGW